MMKPFLPAAALLTAAFLSSSLSAAEFDWPQWQGPDRTGISKEAGLLKEWPKEGPALAWRVSGIGTGYGGPAIAGGRIFGISNRGEDETVWALSEKDGSEIWATRLGAVQTAGMRQGIEGGGCTPTVDGDRLYVLGNGGALACLQVGDGKIVWQRDLIKDFGGQLPTWRFNESPLIDGKPPYLHAGWGCLDADRAREIHRRTGLEDRHSGSGPHPGDQHPGQRGDSPDGGESESEEAEETPAEPGFEPANLVSSGSKWRYLDTGEAPADNWTSLEFKDDAWSEGAAELGYGDRNETTRISSSPKGYPTYYFRRVFEVDDPGSLKPLILRLLRDDGAIVHLNGKELVRSNMPEGAITRETFASSVTPSERGYYVHDLDPGRLRTGKNVVAVEVHQASADSSDVSFDLELREKIPGKDVVGEPRPDRPGGGFAGRGGGGRGFGRSGAAYSSAIAIDFEGQRQYVQFTARALVGVAAADGELLWRYDRPANRSGINCSTPIYLDGHVFAASAYRAGGGLVRLSKSDGGGIKAEEVWFSGNMENHHGGMVVVDDCLYGANGGNGGGYLACLDFKTGEVLWDEGDREKRRVRKGSVVFADGRIYYRTEEGDVILIEPNRSEYLERGRFEQPDRTRQPAWTHPVVANGKLYIRDQDLLLCYAVKEASK